MDHKKLYEDEEQETLLDRARDFGGDLRNAKDNSYLLRGQGKYVAVMIIIVIVFFGLFVLQKADIIPTLAAAGGMLIIIAIFGILYLQLKKKN